MKLTLPTLLVSTELPPILPGNINPQTQARTQHFFWSVAKMFDA
jgi:hypothetical protein